jgi:hypothetical protein
LQLHRLRIEELRAGVAQAELTTFQRQDLGLQLATDR